MNPISIVVPDGSMQEKITGYLKRSGLGISFKSERVKEAQVGVDWISKLMFQRPQEIPLYLDAGYFDAAVVGEDWIENWNLEFPVLYKMPIGRGGGKPIKVVLAVKNTSGINSIAGLPKGCGVATEYIRLAERFFLDADRPDIRILPSAGNTESKFEFGATAIIDVTETGKSLIANGCKIIFQIMESSTVIVANPKSLEDPEKTVYINRFVRLVQGAYQASQFILLIANVSEKLKIQTVRIMGGLKGPTCSPLLGRQGWYALQSIVSREREVEIKSSLLDIGVDDIVVLETSSIMSKPKEIGG
jgi:ATP phosphoribosyltransferase